MRLMSRELLHFLHKKKNDIYFKIYQILKYCSAGLLYIGQFFRVFFPGLSRSDRKHLLRKR